MMSMSSQRPRTALMRQRAPASAGLEVDRRDVAGPVAHQRQCLLGQRRQHELALFAGREPRPGRRIDDLGEEVVLVEMQARAPVQALGRDAGAGHLRQAIHVQRRQPEPQLDLGAERRGPWLAAEDADLECQVVGTKAGFGDRLGDPQRVGGRREQRLRAQVVQECDLPRGHAARHRDDGRAEPLGALVEAQPAGEQAVAVGVVDEHPRMHAGHAQAARHELGPRLEVRACVADHRRPAAGPARGVDANELLASDREEAERVVVAEVGLGGEREARDIVEAGDVAGCRHAGRVEALPGRRDALEQSAHHSAQTVQLQRLEPLAWRDLDLRGCAHAHSSGARGW
jgi:hypothetical protein